MKILAKHRDGEPIGLIHLDVKSNPFGALGWANSILAIDAVGGRYHYRTITDFIKDWEILGSRQHQLWVPGLKYKVGLGTVIGDVLAWFRIYATNNCGCGDRKQWLNWWAAFVPWGGEKLEDEL